MQVYNLKQGTGAKTIRGIFWILPTGLAYQNVIILKKKGDNWYCSVFLQERMKEEMVTYEMKYVSEGLTKEQLKYLMFGRNMQRSIL